MDKKTIEELIAKYHSTQCSEAEKRLVEEWYDNFIKAQHADIPDELIEKDLAGIWGRLEQRERKINIARSTRSWWAVAASILIVFSLAPVTYTAYKKPQSRQTPDTAGIKKESSTESAKPVLMLEDGSRFELDELAPGAFATIGATSFIKLDSSTIALKQLQTAIANPASTQHTSLHTPVGGQFQVILADGTKVVMNAASTLKFPSAFGPSSRQVELSGEAYFEVAKNKLKPFKVKTSRADVEVLGTHFNINSYADEPTTRTTLIEGSVRVSDRQAKSSVILKPGQQSAVNQDKLMEVTDVDAEAALYWKMGLFQFEGADIQFVTRQLARWYNVEFEIAGKLPDTKLWGEVHRNDRVEKALELLTFFDFQYSIAETKGVKKVIIKAK